MTSDEFVLIHLHIHIVTPSELLSTLCLGWPSFSNNYIHYVLRAKEFFTVMSEGVSEHIRKWYSMVSNPPLGLQIYPKCSWDASWNSGEVCFLGYTKGVIKQDSLEQDMTGSHVYPLVTANVSILALLQESWHMMP